MSCVAEPVPRPQAEAELAANPTHIPTLALATPCVHLSATHLLHLCKEARCGNFKGFKR